MLIAVHKSTNNFKEVSDFYLMNLRILFSFLKSWLLDLKSTIRIIALPWFITKGDNYKTLETGSAFVTLS